MELLGSKAEVTIAQASKEKAETAITETETELFAFDNVGYTFEEECELRYLNAALANGDPFRASNELVELITISKKLSKQSKGLFNPAAGELTALWEYHCKTETCPESPYPDEVMKLVKTKDMNVLKSNPLMSDVVVNGNIVSSKNNSVKLEFGDVIRGYAMDKGIKHLKSMGIDNAMIDIGPSARVIGNKGKHPWWIGLHDATGKHILGTIKMSGDKSVVTVNAFSKSASDKGTIYRHVVDPRTGLPVKGIASVTVVHKSAAVANVTATSLMVAGLEHWKAVTKTMGVKAVLIFTDDGTIYLSPAMSQMINWRTEVPHKFLKT